MPTIYPYGVDPFQTYTQGVTYIDASLATDWKDSIRAIQTEELRTYDPDLKPETAHGYNDEFETGALDAKWTPSNCALGTVDMLSVAATKDTYDPTMYTGIMALQPGRDNAGAAGLEAEAAILRQTVVLAANCKVIAKMGIGATYDDGGQSLQGAFAGILLSGASGFDDNNYIFIHASPTININAGLSYIMEGEINVAGAPTSLGVLGGVPGGKVYLGIYKTGNDYSIWSGNGWQWGAGVDGSAPDNILITNANALTRLSIFCYWAPAAAEVNLPNPISMFDYIRYFTNNTPLINA